MNDDHEIVGVRNSKQLMEDIPNKIVTHLGIVTDVNLLSEEGMPRPEYEETCGGVMVTIRRPDLAFSKANVGNRGGNMAVMQLTERQRRIYPSFLCRQLIEDASD